MPRSRPSRALLLLLLVPIALVAIFALWLRDGDDDSVSEPGRLASGEESGLPTLLPRAEGGASAEPLAAASVDGAGGVDDLAAGGADETAHLGQVQGRLVDAADHAVGGEPVFLVRDRDPWQRGQPSPDDESPLAKLVAQGRSDAEGRFTLEAESGVSYQLYAGGATWARVDVGSVVAGDELKVLMREGFVLEGTLRDAGSHAPLENGWVLAWADDCSQLTRTGEDGSFRIGPVPDLVAIVGGYATGYEITMTSEVLPADGQVQLELQPGAPAVGQLVDSETKQPLPGGEVRLFIDVTAQMTGDGAHLPDHVVVDPQVRTVDADGRFEFDSAPQRGFWVEASAPGYVPDKLDTWKDQPRAPGAEMLVELDPVEPIVGRAVVADGGDAASGAEINALALNGQFAAAQAGDDGGFELDESKWDGERPIHVTARDAAGRTARKHVGPREDELLLQLVPPLTVAVQVLQSGLPIVGAQVAATSEGALATRARSGAEGRVTLVHELAGPEATKVLLQARWGNAQSAPVELEVAAGSPAETVVLDLDSGEQLEGVVVDDHGVPVPSALISVIPHPKDAAPQRPTGHSNAEGRFKIGPLVAGLIWDLRIEAEGFHQGRMTEVSPLNGPLLVTLQPVVRWEGRVTDGASGKPATEFGGQLLKETKADNGTLVFKNTRENVRRTPGRPGEFSVALPEPGKYQLRITGKDCLPADSAPIVFAASGGPPPRAELLLWPAAVLEVSVQDSRGRPVRGYEVAVVPWDGVGADGPPPEARKSAPRQHTDDQGLARFNLGQGGSFRIGGGPSTWLDSQRIKAEPGLPVSRQYTLPATGDLEVSVFDEAGQPLSGVQVEVRSAKGDQSQVVLRRTGSRNGPASVLVEGLPVGNYSIRLRRRGYNAGPGEAYVRANATERVRIDMEPRSSNPPPVKGQ